MNSAKVIYQKLIHHNVKHVFGYSGGANLPLLDQFYQSKHIQIIKNSNESCSGFSAEGYSKSLYKVLYFPHQGIFYGDLYVKDSFYSKEIDSVFYPSNILHIELDNIVLNENQSKYYRDNDFTTVILPKSEIKTLYNFFIYILGEFGLKKSLLFVRKEPVLFFVFLQVEKKTI